MSAHAVQECGLALLSIAGGIFAVILALAGLNWTIATIYIDWKDRNK